MPLTDAAAYYALSDGVDATGRGNDVTAQNAPTFQAGVVGNEAVLASASSQYFDRASTDDLKSGAGDFTLDGFFRLTDKVALQRAVFKWAAAGSAAVLEYGLEYNQAADRFRFLIGNGTTSYSVDANRLGSPSTGTRYYIRAWIDIAATTINISVNGSAPDTASYSGTPLQGTGGFAIGQAGAAGGSHWNGTIDEVGLWKRLLTGAEARTRLNGGAWSNSFVGTGTGASVPGAGNRIAPDAAEVFWSPYGWFLSAGAYQQTNYVGQYLKTVHNGTDLYLFVDVNPNAGGGYPTLAWSIGEGAWQSQQLTSGTNYIALASGLSSATRNVLLYVRDQPNAVAWTSLNQVVRIIGFGVNNGGSLSAPTILSPRALILGDSLTAGNLGNAAGNAAEPFAALGKTVGDAFGAEFGAIAIPGQGYTQDSAPAPVLHTVGGAATTRTWDQFHNAASRLTGGLFSPAPDYVWVFHGTNDRNATDAAVRPVVADLLLKLRVASGVSAWIFCTVPPGGFRRTGITNGFNDYQAATPDSKCKLLDIGSEAERGLTAGAATLYSPDGLHISWMRVGQLGAMYAVQGQEAISTLSGSPPARPLIVAGARFPAY